MPATVKPVRVGRSAESLHIWVTGPSAQRSPTTHQSAATALGKEIGRQGHVLLATTESGVPEWSATGALTSGGRTVGFSKALSRKEQARTFGRPADYFTELILSGLDTSSCHELLLRQAEAIIFIPGRTGGLPELDCPLTEKKSIGVLTGPMAVSEEIEHIISLLPKGNPGIVYESDPKKLVAKVAAL